MLPDEKNRLVAPPAARTLNYLFRGQLINLLFLIAMVPAAHALGGYTNGNESWRGLTSVDWFWVCIVIAVVHQFYTWLGWRLQLGWQTFTYFFGRRDVMVFCAVFFPLLIARPILVFIVAWLDRGSLRLPGWISVTSGCLLLVPVFATGYSVTKYFGFARAAGGDHFREAYRNMPLVTQGVFRWTDNAMYSLAFFGLWSIAFLFQSRLALIAAIFQHGYIWAHYLGTEKPDLELIYGNNSQSDLSLSETQAPSE